MVQSFYNLYPAAGLAGGLYDSWSVEKGDRPTLINAPGVSKQTIGTLTVTKGSNAGDFSITVVGTAPNGNAVNITKTYSALAGDSATQVGAALASLINNDNTLNDFLVASNAAGVITPTVIPSNSNPVTSVSGAAAGSGNALTASPTVTNYAANGVITFGYAVGQYSAAQINAGLCSPITTATSLTIAGIALEAKAGMRTYPFVDGVAIDGWAPNEAVPIARVGSGLRVWVPVTGSVVAGTVPGVVNATGQLTTAGSGTALTGATYYKVDGSLAVVQL